MFRRNGLRYMTLALGVALASACESGTGPGNETTFDAEAVLSDFETLDLILQSNAMEGFRAMGSGISFQVLAPVEEFAFEVGQALVVPGSGSAPGALTRGILSAASALGPVPLNAPIISSLRRGKTFVYDAGLGRYVVDQGLEGAPETGVRFLLYEAGPDGKPDPESPIGHADLIDEGDDSPEDIALWLVVMEGTDSILSYRTTVDFQQNGGEIAVDGFLQGEDDRLDFEITVSGSAGEEANTVDIAFEMGLETRPLSMEGTIAGIEGDSGEGGEINLLVQHGEDSFQVIVTGNDDFMDGTVELNGSLFATISGDSEDPTITGADGEPLDWREVLVLRQILDTSEDVFDLWEDLLDPIDEMVILALIL